MHFKILILLYLGQLGTCSWNASTERLWSSYRCATSSCGRTHTPALSSSSLGAGRSQFSLCYEQALKPEQSPALGGITTIFLF